MLLSEKAQLSNDFLYRSVIKCYSTLTASFHLLTQSNIPYCLIASFQHVFTQMIFRTVIQRYTSKLLCYGHEVIKTYPNVSQETRAHHSLEEMQ